MQIARHEVSGIQWRNRYSGNNSLSWADVRHMYLGPWWLYEATFYFEYESLLGEKEGVEEEEDTEENEEEEEEEVQSKEARLAGLLCSLYNRSDQFRW